ncbi:hypothetical protein ONZ51_g11754 [Trametes cubensis]|uniref:Uncharacterized protein n=1 Tax=Trametes cubensis TaxID=1111947 RepID=A0AAD7TJU6_9APHY|nr:hypothetical protein ONZ51_g11754 [Trametes cubensis]
MPARTRPSSPDLAHSLRFHPRPPPHSLSSAHVRRDSYDDRTHPDNPLYALAMPAHLVRIDTSAASAAAPSPSAPADQLVSHSAWSPASQRVYPDPSSIPPHWQVHPAHAAQFRDGRQVVPPGSALQGNNQIPWSRAYPVSGGYVRIVPGQPFVAPPPPPIPHKVWILDCKTCGTFLTNRGMKAVLLLRPNVPLYSTDALPINCSAFSPLPEQPSSTSSHAPSLSVSSTGSSSSYVSAGASSTRSSISGPSSGYQPGDPVPPSATSPERPPSRTWYMIVSPCQRCTSSITANNRSTNGHRFVFYSSEITACERHYVPGERGVSPVPPAASTTSASVTVSAGNMHMGTRTGTPPRHPAAQQQVYPPSTLPSPTVSTPASMPPLSSPPIPAGRRTSVDYLPTSAPDAPSAVLASPISPTPGNLSPSALAARSRTTSTAVQAQLAASHPMAQMVPPVPPNSHTASPHALSTPTFAEPSVHGSPSAGVSLSPTRARAASTSAALTYSHPLSFQPYAGPTRPQQASPRTTGQPPLTSPPPAAAPTVAAAAAIEPLKAGELLYWHHLTRSGEIPAVEEDPRARMGAAAQAEKARAQAELESRAGRRRVAVRGVVAGR